MDLSTEPEFSEHAEAILRFPKEPYPGLRPFLDYEAPLLCGRSQQVGEVIERLRVHRFVAVIGGSGSGKSSLVRAGVVPELRRYGIPAAGDFWVPMVCTPGTNPPRDADSKPRDTPLTRFAWKFNQLLVRTDADKEQARIEQITRLMRKDCGLALVIDTFAGQIRPRAGLTGLDASFLFVIDQFEELFHPTNKDESGGMVEDGRLLVERIIDHFFSPHDSCYLVLTMRSEHLNDCASFLALPEAINRAAYLVPRLDERQLAEAIQEPARNFQRVMRRNDDAVHAGETAFEPTVLQRLLKDTSDLASNPDHLPLLQHLLARLWNAATRRAGTGKFPEMLTGADLANAVLARTDAAWDDLKPGVNVLEQCLVSQADAVCSRWPKDSPIQEQIDGMLRRLAFKDPNTGLYSQQRINVDESNREQLWALVEDGFVGSVNYLHWDDENPQRVTLKVSHESFIRGWPRFRNLIDAEAERFEEFLQMLRACTRWEDQKQSETDLMDGAQLRRIERARLDKVIRSEEQRQRWFGMLLYVYGGRTHYNLRSKVVGYLDASQRKDAVQRKRVWRWRALGCAGLVALVPLTLWFGEDRPYRDRITEFSKALGQLDRTAQTLEGLPAINAWDQLKRVNDAVTQLGSALSGSPAAQDLVWPGMFQIDSSKQVFDDTRQAVEPRVNGTLRVLLTQYPWPVRDPDASTSSFARAVTTPDKDCSVPVKRAEEANGAPGPNASEVAWQPRRGTLYEANEAGGSVPRAIFLSVVDERGRFEMRPAVTGQDGCHAGAPLWQSPPAEYFPGIALDSSLKYMFLITFAPGTGSFIGTLQVLELDWIPRSDGAGWNVGSRRLASVTDQGMIRRFMTVQKTEWPHRPLETTQTDTATVVKMSGGESWEIVAAEAVPVAASSTSQLFTKLDAAPEGRCSDLVSGERVEAEKIYGRSARLTAYARGQTCIVVSRGKPLSGYTPPGKDVVRVTFSRDAWQPNAKYAVARVSFGYQPEATSGLWIGKGERDGWVGLDASGKGDGSRLVAAPLTTTALNRINQALIGRANLPRQEAAETFGRVR